MNKINNIIWVIVTLLAIFLNVIYVPMVWTGLNWLGLRIWATGLLLGLVIAVDLCLFADSIIRGNKRSGGKNNH